MPRAVQREVESLAGKGAGYAEVRRRLGVDPCDPNLGAYRLSGPLAQIVCGLHLRRGFRIAFTMQPSADGVERTAVVILYVGKRQPRQRDGDIWDLLHDLFEVENPPADHRKPPCCEGSQPHISSEGLEAFLIGLRRFQRGR